MSPDGRDPLGTEAIQWVPSCWLQREPSLEAWALLVLEAQTAYGLH